MSTGRQLKLLVILLFVIAPAALMFAGSQASANFGAQQPTSFGPVVEEPFAVVLKRDKQAKLRVMAEHQKLLEARYDLSRRVDPDMKMTRRPPASCESAPSTSADPRPARTRRTVTAGLKRGPRRVRRLSAR